MSYHGRRPLAVAVVLDLRESYLRHVGLGYRLRLPQALSTLHCVFHDTPIIGLPPTLGVVSVDSRIPVIRVASLITVRLPHYLFVREPI